MKSIAVSTATNKSPMRSRDQGPSKREAILDAATRIFLTHGYEGASMDLVAQESGAARRTVYNQFESKEVLFNAAVERVWRDMPVVSIMSDEAALEDPALGLRKVGLLIADFWTPDQAVAFVRMVISESNRFPDLAENFVRLGKMPALRALIDYISAMNGQGIINVQDPDLAARQFVGLVNEPLLWYRVIGVGGAPSKDRRQQVVEEAVATFLARYSAKGTAAAS
ncbi:TetR family transcriptional regulator [Nitratireductor indicus C115]|uniref:TetR family transcriptional regulator n=3 Tax=Nitratireductor indicus TaxID=721133 RepID=K2N4K0_9HYPH|nr:TetR family transcriptional regulator [Nitratireductor indicus C115]